MTSKSKLQLSRALAPLALGSLWLLMIVLVNPRGDFPLGDDWSYARSVSGLLETGQYRLHGWTAMTLLTQVLWGAGFSLLFGGFSFEILRASTLTLGLVAVVAVYGLFREAGARKLVAFVAAASLAVNPIFFSLSFTFMSDVPFAAFAALSLACYARALRLASPGMIVLGTALSVASVLVRQLGLVIPIAFCMAWLVRHRMRVRSLPRAVLPTLLSVLALVGHQRWLAAHGGVPARYVSLGARFEQAWSGGLEAATATTLWNIAGIAIYLGFFVLPVAVLAIPSARKARWGLFAGWLIASAGLTGILAWQHRMLPFLGNILSRRGVGAFTLRGVLETGLGNQLEKLPSWMAVAATLASLVSAGVLAYFSLVFALRLVRRIRRGRSCEAASRIALALAFSAPYVALIMTGWLFDRYILPLAVMAPLALAAPAARGARRPALLMISFALLLGLAGFSVAATHDYLAWNRARWAALGELASQGVPASVIDGGFEFNGSRLYREGYQEIPGKSWWWVQDDEYVIAFAPLPGYRVVNRHPWDRWLVRRQELIYTLHRVEAGAPMRGDPS